VLYTRPLCARWLRRCGGCPRCARSSCGTELTGAAAAELFGAAGAAPGLRSLTITCAALTLEATRALAAAGWRLEELSLRVNDRLGAAGVAALVAAPASVIRRLDLAACGLGRGRPLLAPAAAWRRLPRLRALCSSEEGDLEPPVALAATGWLLKYTRNSLHQKFAGGEQKKGCEVRALERI